MPAVVFLHGSGGLSKATRSWQHWLADSAGVASLAPDSFAFPGRITYQSPVDKAVYEMVHNLRSAELAAALAHLRRMPWIDSRRLLVAGTSEGSVAVARLEPGQAAGRILYAWSCESNYFVAEHGTNLGPQEPILNVMSAEDPYFAPANPWHGDDGCELNGHCAAVVRGNRNAEIVLLPGAPHTLYNLPAARHATQAFIERVFAADDAPVSGPWP